MYVCIDKYVYIYIYTHSYHLILISIRNYAPTLDSSTNNKNLKNSEIHVISLGLQKSFGVRSKQRK